MSWREIGPAGSGGRVSAVAGSATDPKLYYLGAAGGGVWKSANSGQTWDPVFEKEAVASIGAVTIDQTDNKTVWVGTGEANPRNDVSYGDGVYKTTDGGDTWQTASMPGLANSTIWNFAVHAADPQRVYASSVSGEVYYSTSGGASWEKLPREFGEIRALAWTP